MIDLRFFQTGFCFLHPRFGFGNARLRLSQLCACLVKGRAARAVVHWLEVTGITQGPLFRPVSKSDRPLSRRLATDALRTILRHRLQLAGLPVDFATPHGLRAGFLTQAALDGAPLAAAMKLSLHRSAVQAQKYYADVEISENPAADLLGD